LQRAFDGACIGSAIATRAIMEDLRARVGGVDSFPSSFSKVGVDAEGGAGRKPPAQSNFLRELDRVLVETGCRLASASRAVRAHFPKLQPETQTNLSY
jgi:hypothetical protein